MKQPLAEHLSLYEPKQVVEFPHAFALTIEAIGVFWDIRLEELEETRKWVRRRAWKTPNNELMVQLSRNDKYVIVILPNGTRRSLPIFTKGKAIYRKAIYRTNDYSVKAIHQRRDNETKKAVLQQKLRELGIRFEIDFNRYKEDSDYMKVFIDGEEIHSGVTEDLIEKEN